MADLRALYREMAAQGENFRGLSIIQHRNQIRDLITKFGATTVLDFGSGRGDAYFVPYTIHRDWNVPMPTLYDPAFPTHDGLPFSRFDAVLCSDVLEHVPIEDVDAFITTLFGFANKFVWASVCCRPAKKSFPDGTNMHVTIQVMAWWQGQFKKHAGTTPWTLVETP